MITLADELGYHVVDIASNEFVIVRQGERFTDFLNVFEAIEWLEGRRDQGPR